jgi:hypothetical protein
MNKSILKKLIKEEIKNILREGENEQQNYMFFQNLHTIKRMVEKMMQLNPQEVDALLSNGHGWAVDHISTAADDVGEVGTWLCNELGHEMNAPYMMSENSQDEKWNTLYRWIELFSTDNGNFISKNAITDGMSLKAAIQSKKVMPTQIDSITRKSASGKTFSELLTQNFTSNEQI